MLETLLCILSCEVASKQFLDFSCCPVLQLSFLRPMTLHLYLCFIFQRWFSRKIWVKAKPLLPFRDINYVTIFVFVRLRLLLPMPGVQELIFVKADLPFLAIPSHLRVLLTYQHSLLLFLQLCLPLLGLGFMVLLL